jgi:hypothetical protein
MFYNFSINYNNNFGLILSIDLFGLFRLLTKLPKNRPYLHSFEQIIKNYHRKKKIYLNTFFTMEVFLS